MSHPLTLELSYFCFLDGFWNFVSLMIICVLAPTIQLCSISSIGKGWIKGDIVDGLFNLSFTKSQMPFQSYSKYNEIAPINSH